MTLDFSNISVFSFKKNINHFKISNVQNDDLNILEELGVRNSSVFLSNCTIWVEGITDRIYLRRYLELYQTKFKNNFHEDIHYSFIEYGGGNITHFSFLENKDLNTSNINVNKISTKIFLLTDSDNATKGSAKYNRQIEIKERLGDYNYHCLNVREIENLISQEVLKKVISKKEKNEELDFSKLKNYENKKLGEFIEKVILNLNYKYKAASGTIHDKVNFAKLAITCMKDWDDLSEEAQNLTIKIVNFISKSNK